jgi:hypothetical protein
VFSSWLCLNGTTARVAIGNYQVETDHQHSRILSEEGTLQPTRKMLHNSGNS